MRAMTRNLHQIARKYLDQAANLVRALPSGSAEGDGHREDSKRETDEANGEGRSRGNSKSRGRPHATGSGWRPTAVPGYTTPSAVVPNSCIGNHVRHSLDHFSRLWHESPTTLSPSSLASLDSVSEYWPVNYDRRSRTKVDTDPMAALEEIARLLAVLEAHAAVPQETPVRLTATADPVDSDAVTVGSTYGRELWFCCMHAYHHFELIKAICLEHGIPLQNDFGMAPLALINL